MPTPKKQINLSVKKETWDAITAFAKHDNVTLEAKTLSLITMALELEEDRVLSAIAERRDTNDAKYISHEEMWNIIQVDK